MIAWLLGGSALVIGAVAFGWWINTGTMQREINRLETQLKTANESVGTCHANVANLDAALKNQGKDIQALAEASKAAGDRAAKAAAQAAANSNAARVASQRVLALPRPAPEMACEAAARLLRGTQ